MLPSPILPLAEHAEFGQNCFDASIGSVVLFCISTSCQGPSIFSILPPNFTDEWGRTPLLEYTDFCDKRDIVRKLGPFPEKFKKGFETIEKNLRDKVAHAGDYAHNDEEMKLFIERIHLA